MLVLMDEDRVDISQNLILLGLRENVKKLLGDDRVIVDTELIDNAGSYTLSHMQTWVFWPVSADSSVWHVSVL